MMKILSKLVTSADVAAALNRISAVADPDDVNMVLSELARLRLVLDAGEDDDVDYAAFSERLSERLKVVGGTDTSAWIGAGGVP